MTAVRSGLEKRDGNRFCQNGDEGGVLETAVNFDGGFSGLVCACHKHSGS